MKNPIRKLLYVWLFFVALVLGFAFSEQVVFIHFIDALSPVAFVGALLTSYIGFLAGKESSNS